MNRGDLAPRAGLGPQSRKRVQPCLCYGKKRSPSAIFSVEHQLFDIIEITDLEALKHFLDAVHVKFCLLKPWCETENYPLVYSRDLRRLSRRIVEYKGASWFFHGGVRPASESFSEIFQYDIPPSGPQRGKHGGRRLLPFGNARHRPQRPDVPEPPAQKPGDPFRISSGVDTAVLDYYPALMLYLLAMEKPTCSLRTFIALPLRGFSLHSRPTWTARSLRFGLRTGKFKIGETKCTNATVRLFKPVFNGTYGFPFPRTPDLGGRFFPAFVQALGERFRCACSGSPTDDHNHLEQWENWPYAC